MYPYFYKKEKDHMQFSSITVLLCVFDFKTDYGILYPDLRCHFYGEIIKAMLLKEYFNKYYLDSQVFKTHLNTYHANGGEFILSHHSSIQSLLIENENELKTEVTHSISSYFK